jgi:aldose 1-epimerase
MESPLHLSNGRLAVDVDAAAGGRLAQIEVDGLPVLVGRDDVPAAMLEEGMVPAMAWGAFPMVPWAGRIRRGRFTFRGEEFELPINFGDHAIHGVGFSSAWTVTVAEVDHVRLGLELPTDERWPFGGRVVQDIAVAPDRLRLAMEVTAHDRAFPVSFGWHPWFRKPTRIGFHPARMYRRDDDGIAVDDLVEVPPGPWDDCFTNRLPIALTIGGVELTLTSDCTEWVVYDERTHASCFEPQTGPPDAFTIAPRILDPGESHRAWFEIALGRS